MYQAAIFDLDGTIADTLVSIASAANKTLKECGLLPIETDRYRYFAGDGTDTLIERALKAAGDEGLQYFEKAYAVYTELFRKDCTYQVRIFDGMKETLDELKKKGLKLAVVSNKPHERAVTVVETLYGKGYMSCILGQKASLPKKPDPAGTLLAAKELGASPENCLYVGDTDVDMKTGRSAGMFTVGVLWGFRPEEELLANGAQAVIGRPEELTALANGRQFPG